LTAVHLSACGLATSEVTVSSAAADPSPPQIPRLASSNRPILQAPDVRLTPVACRNETPENVSWYVDDLGASFEYKGCWNGGPVGQLVVGVLDADGLPEEAELAGEYAFAGNANSSGLNSLRGGRAGFPTANGDDRVVELRGLSSTGVVVAVPAIAGWADLPELAAVDEGDGALSNPTWIEIVTIDSDGTVLAEFKE